VAWADGCHHDRRWFDDRVRHFYYVGGIGTPCGVAWLVIAAWAIAGLLTITGALCCAELAAMMPKAGGQYVFLQEAYGPATGFLSVGRSC